MKTKSGYVILNLLEHPLTLGETETITDKNIVEQCKCGKPVYCLFNVDDTDYELWLVRENNTALTGKTSGNYIEISINTDNIEVISDELA